MFQTNPLFFQRGTIDPSGVANIVTTLPYRGPALTGEDIRRSPLPTPRPVPKGEIPKENIQLLGGALGGATVAASTGNPALQNILAQANQLIQDFQVKGGILTPDIQSRIQAINDAEERKVLSVAEGRSAAERGDIAKVDESVSAADQAEIEQENMLRDLMEELRKARVGFVEALTPSAREAEIQESLRTLRTERQLLPLELRQEGISAAGIQGRQIEDERVRAIQEQNLLMELGFEQEARSMRSKAFEGQIGFISDDIDLQIKLEDRLQKQEQEVLDRARQLSRDSVSTLSNIVEQFSGLAWTDLDAQTQEDVLNLIKPFPDLTLGIVSAALQNAKQQQVYERAKKATEKPATAAQETVAAYAARIEQANPLIKSYEGDISEMSVIGYELQKRLPASLQSDTFRAYDQAARNFINAVLRRESGAAIAASEFESAERQYLPIAGDNATILAQKEANRKLVFESLKKSSGPAFSSVEELLGGGVEGRTQEESYIDPNTGTEYVKGEDGNYYAR